MDENGARPCRDNESLFQLLQIRTASPAKNLVLGSFEWIVDTNAADLRVLARIET
jgi:hypothetical protein